jgi:anti-sigma factor RsiW
MMAEKFKELFKMLVTCPTCLQTHRLLFDFVEGSLTPEQSRKLEAHLADCPECLEFVRTYRSTIQVTHTHGLPEGELPAPLEQKLRDFIKQNPELK